MKYLMRWRRKKYKDKNWKRKEKVKKNMYEKDKERMKKLNMVLTHSYVDIFND